MSSNELAVVLKRLDAPDEVRKFEKGRFELVHLGGMTIDRATYQPGWRWSEHVGPSVGASYCHVEHVGLVLAGTAAAAFGPFFQLSFEATIAPLRSCSSRAGFRNAFGTPLLVRLGSRARA